jgi:hypothetical protein
LGTLLAASLQALSQIQMHRKHPEDRCLWRTDFDRTMAWRISGMVWFV